MYACIYDMCSEGTNNGGDERHLIDKLNKLKGNNRKKKIGYFAFGLFFFIKLSSKNGL